MNRFFQIPSPQLAGWSGLMLGIAGLLGPLPAHAEVPLTRADVESLYNQVEFIPEGQSARPARLNDWLAVGDALRTELGARAELRFNDGSLARVGERATFWFVPNTRDFRLSNGTALFLIPPDRGPSNIRTPSAVTGIQGTALVVRHIPRQTCDAPATLTDEQACPGRTVVMVLTNSPKGPVEVTASNGNSASLSAGELAVVENGAVQVMEFNLQLFYDTSPLVEGLELDNPNFEGTGMPTDPVRQETWEGLQSQSGFDGNYLLNPSAFALDAQLSAEMSWLLPTEATKTPMLANDLATTPLRALPQVETLASGQNPARQALMSTWLTNTLPILDVPQASVPGLVLPSDIGQPPIRNIRPITPSTNGPTPTVLVGPPAQRPVGMPGGGVPADVPGGGVPADVPGGGIPADVPGGGVPADVPGGGIPADVPGGGVPADVPGGGVPADVPGGGVPADVPGGGIPADVPGQPGEFPAGPGEFPAGPNDDLPGGPIDGNDGPDLEVPFDPAG